MSSEIFTGVAQIDGLQLTYAPLYIADLRQRRDVEGDETCAGLLAAAKLCAAENDLPAARACLDRAFSFLGNAGDSTWEEHVWAGFVCRQFDLVETLIRGRFGVLPEFSFSLGGETSRSWPINAFKYRVIDRCKGAFEVHLSMYNTRHIEFMVHRLLAMLPLLASYSVHNAVESGTIVLNVGDVGSLPGLAFCESRDEFFLVPDNYFVETQGYRILRENQARNPVAWQDRKPVAFWRGATTGKAENAKVGWRSLPRVQLCEMAQADDTGLFDVGLTRVAVVPGDTAGAEIAASGLIRPYVPSTAFQNYKYQIDIDGHSNSWPGLFQKLLTGSPVLKVASPHGFRQWYYGELRPWVNFVPVAADMTDLAEIVAWLRNHDDVARQIGRRGQALAMAMDYAVELKRAGRTIGAALRYFAGRPELELRFGPNGDGHGCLMSGWGGSVSDGVETEGVESRLALMRPVQNEDYVLSLEVSAAAAVDAAAQRIAVIVNGHVVNDSVLARRQVLHCGISRRTLQASEKLYVTLLHPDARPANSKGRPLDTRIASVVLHCLSLTLARAHNAQHPWAFATLTGAGSETAPARLPDGVQPRRIGTHHNTEIYIDEATGALRHGPAQAGAHNAGIVVRKNTAFICHRGPDGRWRPPGNFVGMSLVFVAGRESSAIYEFEIDGAPNRAFGLRRDGLLLCAEGDGRVTLSRQKRGPWESFKVIRD